MRVWFRVLFVCYVFHGFIEECDSARIHGFILAYIPLPFYSHQAVYRPLWKELANRGHQISLVTLNPMEENHENITQIDLSITYRWLEENNFVDLLSSGSQSLKNVHNYFELILEAIGVGLSQPNMKNLINEHFDLVITEFYFSLGAAFAHKYNCPLIGVAPIDGTSDMHNAVGNPTNPILYPAINLGFIEKLNFKQRLISATYYAFWKIYAIYLKRQQDLILRKYFGNDLPPLHELEKNVTMFFIKTNPVFHAERPLSGRTVNVGIGLHIEQPKPLPDDIQLFLDESAEGVVYFSLGSAVKSSHISSKTKSVIAETFFRLPYKILWKFEKAENDTFLLSENVRISKWLPQQDVMRHPNIKLFITQGGLQSLEEALLCGVPVLALPFFGDQILNSQKVVQHGFGLSLNHKTLDRSEFGSAILEIISTPRFKESAMRLSRQLSDQPMTGVERAVWWTEYVLRHGNVYILKNPFSDIPLYQYYFLDIIISFLCVCVALVYCVKVVFKVIVYLFSLLGKRSKHKKE